MTPTPLGALARGLAAGVAGTAAMTAYQEVVSAARRMRADDGGEPEKKQEWSEAPAPAQVGKRILEGLFQRDVSERRIALLTHLVHWGYGTAWGAVYGVVAGTLRPRALPSALAFGTTVWAVQYVVLPAMNVYKPLWEYPPKTLAVDLSYHLVYGAGVAAAYDALERATGAGAAP